MTGDNTNAGVSATLRVRSGRSLAEQAVRETIARAIPGVDPAKVYISIHHADGDEGPAVSEGVERSGGQVARVPLTDFLWLWRVPESDYNSLALGVLLGILVVFGLGTVVGSSLSSYRRARSTQSETGNSLNPSRRLPGSMRDQRVRPELPEPPTAGEP